MYRVFHWGLFDLPGSTFHLSGPSRTPCRAARPFLAIVLFFLYLAPASSQRRPGNPISGSTPGAIPLINVGAGPMEAQFERLTFAQMILNEQNRASEKERARQQNLIDSGTVSAL